MTMQSYQCRAVVVGTGAGGAVAGAMLAEAGVDTLILEWGRQHNAAEHRDVVDSMARMYVDSGATMAVGRPPVVIPLGRAVGGTTLVNSATCFRPPRDKVAAWAGPAYEELEPLFEEVEKRINAVVLDAELLGGNGRVLKRGGDALGVAVKPLTHNVRDCKGRGRCAFGCPADAKQSMDLTFIPDAVSAGARLLASHRVDGFIFKGARIAGLRGQCETGPFEVHADVVVLAMGAMFTPAFLLKHKSANRSGRVGKNLNIHPASRVVAEFDEIVDAFKGVPQGVYADHWQDRGIMIEGIFTPPGPLLASLPGAGLEYKALAAAYRRIAASGVMISDTAAGSVRSGLFGAPFQAFYQLSRADALSMRFGIARLSELYLAAGAKRVFTGFAPVPVVDGPDALARLEAAPVKPTDFELLAFHPLGTCAMGADAKASVVDFDLRCHDFDNLYVMDASVIPHSLGVNPQITVMTLAMRAARRLAARLA
jgi:choline dehydrogenase-like flavoprotein